MVKELIIKSPFAVLPFPDEHNEPTLLIDLNGSMDLLAGGLKAGWTLLGLVGQVFQLENLIQYLCYSYLNAIWPIA